MTFHGILLSTIVDISFEASLISAGAEWDIINGGMRGRLASEDIPAPVRQPRSDGYEEDDGDDRHRGHSRPLRNYSSSHWWPNGLTRRSPPVVSKETWCARDNGKSNVAVRQGREWGSWGKFDETKWSQRKCGGHLVTSYCTVYSDQTHRAHISGMFVFLQYCYKRKELRQSVFLLSIMYINISNFFEQPGSKNPNPTKYIYWLTFK